MEGIFKLLVVAVVAVVAVMLIALLIGFFNSPSEDPITAIKRQLSAAQSIHGKSTPSKTLSFPNYLAFKSETFENQFMNVAFKCNLGLLCNNKDRIDFEERKIEIQKMDSLNVSSRCKDDDIFICKVYLGTRPAQIDELKVTFSGMEYNEAEERYEIEPEKDFTMDNSFTNSGKLDGFDVKAFVKFYLFDQKNLELISEDIFPVSNIIIGETKTKTLNLKSPKTEGKYKIKIRFEGEDTGYDTFELEFFVKARPCNAEKCTEPEWLKDQCITHCSCDDCVFGFTCREHILDADAGQLKLLEGMELKDEKSNIRGSNIVDFEVDESFCESLDAEDPRLQFQDVPVAWRGTAEPEAPCCTDLDEGLPDDETEDPETPDEPEEETFEPEETKIYRDPNNAKIIYDAENKKIIANLYKYDSDNLLAGIKVDLKINNEFMFNETSYLITLRETEENFQIEFQLDEPLAEGTHNIKVFVDSHTPEEINCNHPETTAIIVIGDAPVAETQDPETENECIPIEEIINANVPGCTSIQRIENNGMVIKAEEKEAGFPMDWALIEEGIDKGQISFTVDSDLMIYILNKNNKGIDIQVPIDQIFKSPSNSSVKLKTSATNHYYIPKCSYIVTELKNISRAYSNSEECYVLGEVEVAPGRPPKEFILPKEINDLFVSDLHGHVDWQAGQAYILPDVADDIYQIYQNSVLLATTDETNLLNITPWLNTAAGSEAWTHKFEATEFEIDKSFVDENWKKVDIDTANGPVTIKCSVCVATHCYVCVAGDLMITPDGKYEMAGMCRYMPCYSLTSREEIIPEFDIAFE